MHEESRDILGVNRIVGKLDVAELERAETLLLLEQIPELVSS